MGDFDVDARIARERTKEAAFDGTDLGRRRRQVNNARYKDEAYVRQARTSPDAMAVASLRPSWRPVTIEVRVVTLEPRTLRQQGSGLHQAGLLADASGKIRFSSWESADPPTLDVGRAYRIRGARVRRTKIGVEVQFVTGTIVEGI